MIPNRWRDLVGMVGVAVVVYAAVEHPEVAADILRVFSVIVELPTITQVLPPLGSMMNSTSGLLEIITGMSLGGAGGIAFGKLLEGFKGAGQSG